MTDEMNVIDVEKINDVPNSTEPGVISRIARGLFRILVAVVIGLALGAGLYYGAIRLYREVIEPIQTYEARIHDLERSLELIHQELEADSSVIAIRQAEIEGRLAEQAEAIASAEAMVGIAQADIREQRAVLITVEDLSETMEDISLALGSVSLRVEQLEEDIAAGDLPAQRVQRTAVFLRAMSLLTRARLELDRDNLGFASEQVEAAQLSLKTLVTSESSTDMQFGDEQILTTIIERLDLVLQDIRSRPLAAADELEAVWKLFIQATEPLQSVESEAGGE